MKTIFSKLVLRAFNWIFSCNVELRDIESLKILCKERLHLRNDVVESIKVVIAEGLRIKEEDAGSIKVVVAEGLRIKEEDARSIKVVIAEGLRIKEEDAGSIKVVVAEGLRIKEEDARSIKVVIAEGLRIKEEDAGSIKVVVAEGLRIKEEDAGSIKVVIAEGLRIKEEDAESVKQIINALNANVALAQSMRGGLVQQLDAVALLNRLGDIGDISEGVQLSYAQEGESLILDRFFDFRSDGFFVDVGAHHPKRFSNTYSFYKRGWSGINIDPTPGVKKIFDEIRPRDIFLSAAVSNVEGKQDFYLFSEPALNTFSKSLAEEYQQTGCQLLEVQSIESRRLSSLLDDCHIDRPIDFMSIDVEDHELPVLQSNDWERYRPVVLLVEILNFDLGNPDAYSVHQFILDKGYVLFAKTYNTLFYKDAR
jgi:FkbM family methyltransferase